MTPAMTLDLHPAPAAPAPAPSQIRFPRGPHKNRLPEFPVPGGARTKMVLLRAQSGYGEMGQLTQSQQEYPTWLH
ncbi:hypothetical protein [Pseudophaeobacter sp.]|uniref:hypothetical protein n=1 Tax=Pseudophaeobacter sp. TaxID=1971739 RepID=UPI00329824B5